MRVNELIKAALAEDLGAGDVTNLYLDLGALLGRAFMVAKAKGVLAGVEIARQVFQAVDEDLKVTIYRKDGDVVAP